MDDVFLSVGDGEILAVVGENGAGKTTLMNVLYGLYQPDAGQISIDGTAVRFRGPREAIARGIGMVHQHFMLVPGLTVVENVVLGAEPTRAGLLDFPRARAQVAETCRRFKFTLDLEAPVDALTVGAQQKVEIVKALHRGARVLILDEPTAVLTPQEADELFTVARSLASSGHSIIFISHKLKEVLAVAWRIVVMRQGRVVAEVSAADTSAQKLAEQMVGDKANAVLNAERGPRGPAAGARRPGDQRDEEVLTLRDVEVRGAAKRSVLKGLSLGVRSSEIVGIAGVEGNGQKELAEIVSGLRRLDGGVFLFNGRDASRLAPQELRRRGLAHIPEDRLLRAVVPTLTVEENASLGRQNVPPFASGPFINFPGRRTIAKALLADYDVRPADENLPIQALSGGNQQKVVVGRELGTDPILVLAVQPTRGLDVTAATLVHHRLRQVKERGGAVLLISLDLDEVLSLSDRIFVVFDGRISGRFNREEFDERAIGRRMLGTEAVSEGGAGVTLG